MFMRMFTNTLYIRAPTAIFLSQLSRLTTISNNSIIIILHNLTRNNNNNLKYSDLINLKYNNSNLTQVYIHHYR